MSAEISGGVAAGGCLHLRVSWVARPPAPDLRPLALQPGPHSAATAKLGNTFPPRPPLGA
jgi:hypothetical protein